MKKISIKLPTVDSLRESEEDRKRRIANWRTTDTRVVESKKVYNRKKFKNEAKSFDCYQ